MEDKNILITGGMGFIGPTIIENLSRNNNVVVVDRLDYGIAPILKAKVDKEFELIKEDLSEISEVHQRIQDGEFEIIIHMASMSLIPVCENRPNFAYRSNTISPLNILRRIHNHAVFLNFSTSAVYAPANSNHGEDDYYDPIDIYGWTKKHTEELACFYSKKFDFPVINIRLANAVGYGETNLKLFGEILAQIEKGNNEIMLGNLTPKRDYIHIEDIAWVVENLIDSNYVKNGDMQSFNVGTGYDPISVLEVFNLINQAFNGKLKLIEDKSRKRPIEQERELLAINVSKLKNILPNYKPKMIQEWIRGLALDPGLRIGEAFSDDIYLKE